MTRLLQQAWCLVWLANIVSLPKDYVLRKESKSNIVETAKNSCLLLIIFNIFFPGFLALTFIGILTNNIDSKLAIHGHIMYAYAWGTLTLRGVTINE